MALADAAYLALTAEQAYFSGHPTDLVWFAGLLLLAVGAWADQALPVMPVRSRRTLGIPGASPLRRPYWAGAGAVAWLVSLLAEGRGPQPGPAGGGAGCPGVAGGSVDPAIGIRRWPTAMSAPAAKRPRWWRCPIP